MNIPASVKKHLTQQGGQFKVRQAEAGDDLLRSAREASIPLQKLAQAQVVKDGNVFLMAVIPASHSLELDVLNGKSKRNFNHCESSLLSTLFHDCHIDALPPFGKPYGIKVIIDKALDTQDEIFFAAGIPGLYIRAGIEDFRELQEDAWRNHSISVPVNGEASPAKGTKSGIEAMKEKVQDVSELPPMPGIALQIMKVRNNPYANISELASVVEQDPSLSAQIIRYAGSPFYGYQGKVDSVAMAITRVLGMDFVMDLAFGLSLGKSFNNPKGGPIGLEAFWRHASYCASLTQKLCNSIDYMSRPSPGMAYLAGLLHNFGILLLGHQFPEQFARLNQALIENPDRPILDLEREQLGITHTEMGMWLMDAWNMPREIVETVREHHNGEHRSDFSIYANLVHIANRLLKRHGIGEAESMDLDEEMLEDLGLDEVRAEAALGAILESSESIEFMAARMAA